MTESPEDKGAAAAANQAAALNAIKPQDGHGTWTPNGTRLQFGVKASSGTVDQASAEVHHLAQVLDKIRAQQPREKSLGIHLGIVVTGDASVLTPENIAAAEKALAEEAAARAAGTPENSSPSAVIPVTDAADAVQASPSSSPSILTGKTPGKWLEETFDKGGQGALETFRERWNKEIKPALMAAGQTVIEKVSLGGSRFDEYDFSGMTVKEGVFFPTNNSFIDANFEGSDLSQTRLTIEQLKKAITNDDTILPPGIDRDELTFRQERFQQTREQKAEEKSSLPPTAPPPNNSSKAEWVKTVQHKPPAVSAKPRQFPG